MAFCAFTWRNLLHTNPPQCTTEAQLREVFEIIYAGLAITDEAVTNEMKNVQCHPPNKDMMLRLGEIQVVTKLFGGRGTINVNLLSRFYLDALLGLVPIRNHGAERAVRTEHEGRLVEWAHANLGVYRTLVLR